MYKESINTDKKPQFLLMSKEQQRVALEAIIFATDEPLSTETLFRLLLLEESPDYPSIPDDSQITIDDDVEESFGYYKEEIENLIDEINKDLLLTGRAFHIVNFAGGWQFATRGEYGRYIELLGKTKSKRRLSQAALESLAVIAYKQPVTKPEIEKIRGVNSNEVVNSLIEKNLVRIAGRSDAPGKPLLYATTDDFLRMFGLYSLRDLPKLRELEEFAESFYNHKNEEDTITFNVSDDELPEDIIQEFTDISVIYNGNGHNEI